MYVTINRKGQAPMEVFVTSRHEISDGYHTMEDLYDHRCALFLLLCLRTPTLAWWKPDGDEGWFILFLELHSGQISYHMPAKYKGPVVAAKLAKGRGEWDKHDAKEVLARLECEADVMALSVGDHMAHLEAAANASSDT